MKKLVVYEKKEGRGACAFARFEFRAVRKRSVEPRRPGSLTPSPTAGSGK